MKDKIDLVFIAGVDRNGSTLFSRILGENKDCQNIGEGLSYMLNSRLRSRHLPDSFLIDHKNEVTFWEEVFKEAGFNYISDKIDELISEKNNAKMEKFANSGSTEVKEIQKKIVSFYSAVKKVSGKKYIIDSSKRPNLPLLLTGIPELEVTIVHMVRNAEDAVSSRSKKKKYLESVPTLKMIGRWVRKNRAAAKLKKHFKYIKVFYDDLCSDPYGFTKNIADFANITPFTLNELKNKNIMFHPQPILAGNPDKFTEGLVVIEKRMPHIPAWKLMFVKLVTTPWK